MDVTKLIAFETGSLSDEETVELFQTLVDRNIAWSLQGMYGRIADQLIEAGLVTRRSDNS